MRSRSRERYDRYGGGSRYGGGGGGGRYGGGSGGGGGIAGRSPPPIEGMTSLKVDNLNYQTTLYDLRNLFEKYGDVGDVYIPRDKYTGQSRGFAFVRFFNRHAAEDAIDQLDGYMFEGREIHVQQAKYGRPDTPGRGGWDSHRRSGGGGGGGSYGYRSSGRYRSRSRSPRRRSYSRSSSRSGGRKRASRSRSRSARASHSRSRSHSRD